MNLINLGKLASGIAVASLLLSACSGTAQTGISTSTATPEATAEPQTYAAPTPSPVNSATGTAMAPQATIMPDATTSKPALSTKDDAASINTDLNNTAVTPETFN